MILPQRHAVARPNRNDTFPAPRPSPTALLNSPQRVNAGYSLFFSLQFSARESLHPRPLTISLETEPPSDGRHLTLRAGTPTKLPTRNGVPSRQKNTQKKIEIPRRENTCNDFRQRNSNVKIFSREEKPQNKQTARFTLPVWITTLFGLWIMFCALGKKVAQSFVGTKLSESG